MIILGFTICFVSAYGIVQILIDNHTTKDTLKIDPYDLYCIDDNILDYDSRIKLRLTKSLKTICKQLQIHLKYYDDIEGALGRIWTGVIFDGITLGKVKIAIRKEYINEPLVLAHELGHYMAVKQRNDYSELGADREALKLCSSILTPDEYKVIGGYLIKHFTRYELK